MTGGEPWERSPAEMAAEPDRRGAILGLSRAGFHRLAYVEWGDPHARRVALCVHGLSRQGRDFDRLAMALAARGWRVVCPDLVGRGRSDWLRDPEDYTLPQYVRDLTALIARLDVPEVDWIGTSLGGLIGMVVAGQRGAPVRRLVVNDIGPFVPWQDLRKLGAAVRDAPRVFPDLDAATRHYRTALAPFGRLSDAEWRHLARHGLAREADGTWRVLCDPNITAPFRTGFFVNLSLWSYWDAIRCPTLALRGVESDLLSPLGVREMSRRGPRAQIAEFPACGHAPALMDPAQIGTVVDWLEHPHPQSG